MPCFPTEPQAKRGEVTCFLHLRVHLRLQIPAAVPRLDDLIPVVIILRHAVEVTGIRHGFHHPPPQTVEGGFVDGHVRIVQRRFNKPIPGVVGVFEVAVEGEVATVVVRGGNVCAPLNIRKLATATARPRNQSISCDGSRCFDVMTVPHSGQTPEVLPTKL